MPNATEKTWSFMARVGVQFLALPLPRASIFPTCRDTNLPEDSGEELMRQALGLEAPLPGPLSPPTSGGASPALSLLGPLTRGDSEPQQVGAGGR